MCENDAAVDAWVTAVRDYVWDKVARGEPTADPVELGKLNVGLLIGVIRELAATVPGVREWLIEHMPGVTP